MVLVNILYLAPPPKVLFVSIIVLNLFPWPYILHSIQTEVLFVIKNFQLYHQISIFVCIIGKMTNSVSNTLCIDAKKKLNNKKYEQKSVFYLYYQ